MCGVANCKYGLLVSLSYISVCFSHHAMICIVLLYCSIVLFPVSPRRTPLPSRSPPHHPPPPPLLQHNTPRNPSNPTTRHSTTKETRAERKEPEQEQAARAEMSCPTTTLPPLLPSETVWTAAESSSGPQCQAPRHPLQTQRGASIALPLQRTQRRWRSQQAGRGECRLIYCGRRASLFGAVSNFKCLLRD